jgi:hypothetical protein
MSKKMYLGDSVYVELDDSRAIVLTTWNGYDDDPRNRIVLEPEVMERFELWLKSLEPAEHPEDVYNNETPRP